VAAALYAARGLFVPKQSSRSATVSKPVSDLRVASANVRHRARAVAAIVTQLVTQWDWMAQCGHAI